jgi:hypothetical protein
MDAIIARQALVDIAARDVGKTEVTSNRAPWLAHYWPETSYPDGYAERAPYCAAAMCYWLATWGRLLAQHGKLRDTMGMSLVSYEQWRCKYAGAWRWQEWALKRGLLILPDTAPPMMGDIMIFDMSHIGLVERVAKKGRVNTIEANTGPSGGRDGDGVWRKDREQSLARAFIRVIP